MAWKDTLSDWKKQNKGCVPKHIFPRLLKKALLKIEANSAKNIKAGFRASGIFPLNKNAVLKNLPTNADQPNTRETATDSFFSEQLVKMLKEERFGKAEQRTIPRKRRLMDVQPGSSVSEQQVQQLLANKVKVEAASEVDDVVTANVMRLPKVKGKAKVKSTNKAPKCTTQHSRPLKDLTNIKK